MALINRLICTLVLFLVAGLLSAEEFQAKVVRISDGDTIAVLKKNKIVWLRLKGIDCPEDGQAKSKLAEKFTRDSAFNKLITVKTHGKDRYGRVLAEIQLENGSSLNQTLVRSGYCRWYRNLP